MDYQGINTPHRRSKPLRLWIRIPQQTQIKLLIISAQLDETISTLANKTLAAYKQLFGNQRSKLDRGLTVTSLEIDGYYMSKNQKVGDLLRNNDKVVCNIVRAKGHIYEERVGQIKKRAEQVTIQNEVNLRKNNGQQQQSQQNSSSNQQSDQQEQIKQIPVPIQPRPYYVNEKNQLKKEKMRQKRKNKEIAKKIRKLQQEKKIEEQEPKQHKKQYLSRLQKEEDSQQKEKSQQLHSPRSQQQSQQGPRQQQSGHQHRQHPPYHPPHSQSISLEQNSKGLNSPALPKQDAQKPDDLLKSNHIARQLNDNPSIANPSKANLSKSQDSFYDLKGSRVSNKSPQVSRNNSQDPLHSKKKNKRSSGNSESLKLNFDPSEGRSEQKGGLTGQPKNKFVTSTVTLSVPVSKKDPSPKSVVPASPKITFYSPMNNPLAKQTPKHMPLQQPKSQKKQQFSLNRKQQFSLNSNRNQQAVQSSERKEKDKQGNINLPSDRSQDLHISKRKGSKGTEKEQITIKRKVVVESSSDEQESPPKHTNPGSSVREDNPYYSEPFKNIKDLDEYLQRHKLQISDDQQ